MTLLPTGFRDRLPPEADASARLARAIIDAVASYGYERVQPPLAEFEAAMKGTGRDQLRFVDPASGETMAIRSDMTGQIGRIASTRMGHHPRPVRLSYAGPVLKLRATQLRPEREMMQVGAELIGADSLAAVSEILNVAVEALKAAGARDITLDLTMPDLVDTLAAGPLPVADVGALKSRLDAKDAANVPEAYRPLITASGSVADALDRLRAFAPMAGLADRLDHVATIAESLPGDIRVTLDPTELHGFEYQSWIGFSVFAANASGEIARGGTYRVGDEAAVGFSAYVDPLVDAGLAQGARRRLFLPIGTLPAKAARLRSEGWITVAALTADDSAEAQICTHILRDGQPQPL